MCTSFLSGREESRWKGEEGEGERKANEEQKEEEGREG